MLQGIICEQHIASHPTCELINVCWGVEGGGRWGGGGGRDRGKVTDSKGLDELITKTRS